MIGMGHAIAWRARLLVKESIVKMRLIAVSVYACCATAVAQSSASAHLRHHTTHAHATPARSDTRSVKAVKAPSGTQSPFESIDAHYRGG
jgi:uncharacterized Zn-finger protein